MKIKFGFLSMLVAVTLFATSCSKDDAAVTPGGGGGSSSAEDGWYISGEATSLSSLTYLGLFSETNNENDANKVRTGLYSKYVVLTANKTFCLTKVEGPAQSTFGAGADSVTYNPNKKNDQINANVTCGTLTAGQTIKVGTTGLYQVNFDVTTNKFAIVLITHPSIIGGATKAGWSDTPMALEGTLSGTGVNTYSVSDVIMIPGKFKLRFSDGWKVQVSDTAVSAIATAVKVNTNYGDTITALSIGAKDMTFTETGVFKVSMSIAMATGKWTATIVKTGIYTPPAFPAEMYLVGDATAYGWTAPGTDATLKGEMHVCAGGGTNEGVFWKILFLEGGKGFKIAGKNWGEPNMGFAAATSFDGIAVTADAGGNMSVATSGMYMVVLDLKSSLKKVSVSVPLVYAAGDAFGGYPGDVADATKLFTVDNTAKTLTSPAATAAGNLRSYVAHAWIAAWWNSEFIVSGTDMQYRNDGGDPIAVPLTVGQTVTYSFDTNTGSIQ